MNTNTPAPAPAEEGPTEYDNLKPEAATEHAKREETGTPEAHGPSSVQQLDAMSTDEVQRFLDRYAAQSARLAEVERERDEFEEQATAEGEELRKDKEAAIVALDKLKSAVCETLLPAVNEAIKAGFKITTWSPELIAWEEAVNATDAILAARSPKESTP